jgi:hypothetical protein
MAACEKELEKVLKPMMVGGLLYGGAKRGRGGNTNRARSANLIA